MKKLLTLALTLLTLTTFGQTAQEHLKNGIEKHKKQDYKGAVREYDKAIKADNSIPVAYYNRATCEMALNEFKPAIEDFTKTIELDNNYAEAYYGRATAFVSQEKYAEALPDLDKVIAIRPEITDALTLRGQIRAQTGDKDGACTDFADAKKLGNKEASKYIKEFCGDTKTAEKESLMLDWPDSEHWKTGSAQENDKMIMVELIREGETLEKWTEFGYMASIIGAVNVPMDKIMNITLEQAKKNAPKAKLTFIEKDETAEYPWILFIIESPEFKDDKIPESQLWYIVQGKTALYTNFRAVKKAKITQDQEKKWSAFFKTAKVVNR